MSSTDLVRNRPLITDSDTAASSNPSPTFDSLANVDREDAPRPRLTYLREVG
jgi:hypothetical protein